MQVVLTADLGNSATKLALWPARAPDGWPRPLARHSWPRGVAPDLGAWSAELGRSAGELEWVAAAACSVASPERADALAEALWRTLGLRLRSDLEPGIDSSCDHPESVGRDRLFAARAAAERVGGGAVVIDAGTALTVDAVAWDRSGGGRPRFLGGAIAPGPRLLAGALARGTARLPEVDAAPGAAALGRETRAAIAAGVSVGFFGAAQELARRVGLAAGLAGAPRVLTGGARAFLLEPTPFWSGDLLEEPDLVALGLWLALGGPASGAAQP